MGADSNLYLSNEHSLDDIVKVIERTQKTKVSITAYNDIIGMYGFSFNDRFMYVHVNVRTPICKATLLSLHANADGIKIMRDIANVFGGILQEIDCAEEYEFIDGALSPHGALPYFLKYAITRDGISNSDLPALQESIKKWIREISPETGIRLFEEA